MLENCLDPRRSILGFLDLIYNGRGGGKLKLVDISEQVPEPLFRILLDQVDHPLQPRQYLPLLQVMGLKLTYFRHYWFTI